MRFLKSIRNLLGNYQLKSGIYHYERGEAGQAVEYLTKALQAPDTTEPDRRMAMYYLTQTYIAAAEKFEESGDTTKAVEAYRQALQIAPDYPDIQFRMGALCARFGLTLEAIESYRRAVESHPEYLEARVNLGFLLLKNGDKEEAARQFAAARDLSVQAIEGPYRKGREALARGAASEGEEWFREAFQRQPESFAFHYRRGLKALRDSHYEEAAEEFRRAIEFQPNFADVHNFLGVACGEQEIWPDSIAAFRRALEVNPDYLVARLNLACALSQGGEERAAAEELRSVLSAEPENQPALALLEGLSAPRRERSRVQQGESGD